MRSVQVYEGDGVRQDGKVGRFGVRYMDGDRWLWVGPGFAWGTSKQRKRLDPQLEPVLAWRGDGASAFTVAQYLREPTSYPCPFEGWCITGYDIENKRDLWFLGTKEGLSDRGVHMTWLMASCDRRVARVYQTPDQARSAYANLTGMNEHLIGVSGWGQ